MNQLRALRLVALFGTALMGLGCEQREGARHSAAGEATTPSVSAAAPAQLAAQPQSGSPPNEQTEGNLAETVESKAPDVVSAAACAERIRALAGTLRPALDTAFERNRAQLLMRTSGAPSAFYSSPVADEARWKGIAKVEVIRAYRKHLETARWSEPALKGLLSRLEGARPLLRAVLLTDGYLYSANPELARALERNLTLEMLFDAPELSLVRGGERFELTRNPAGHYVHRDGAFKGKDAKLLFLDRFPAEGASANRHFDLSSAQQKLGFEAARVLSAAPGHVVAELGYRAASGELVWEESLLEGGSPAVAYVCGASEQSEVAAARALALRRVTVWNRIERVIQQQIAEELPFDEPDNEWGQQDGHLRQRWHAAYLAGEERYDLNFRYYPVFTSSGATRAPQVCIDFISETLERASGTHYRGRGEQPGRVVGNLDFDALLGDERRSVLPFVDYARHAPGIAVKDFSGSQRVPYQFRSSFFKLLEQRAELRQGDIVVIRGYAPWDMNHVEHSHSFFIYRTDPLTGVPIRLVGNAGHPELRGWDREMGRAPRRSIRHRIRPSLEWLEQITQPVAGAAQAG
ncbi:MAG: hypothetical protein AB7K71_13030 [Polyangiaceae bacterium]